MKRSLTSTLLTGAGVAAMTAGAWAQTIEYDVTLIPDVPVAFSTVPLALNNRGVVVGWAQALGDPFFLSGWRWSVADGMSLLPPPPGRMSNRFSATDINDDGMIAGDGGSDSGHAWRLVGGTYQIAASLPGTNASRRSSINSLGQIVATAFDAGSFLVPSQAMAFDVDGSVSRLLPELSGTRAAAINDSGQILASRSAQTIRIEPDGSRTIIPQAPGFVAMAGSVMNNAGDVAGVAVCVEECNQPWIYGDEDGLVLLPVIATRVSPTGINASRQIVGRVTQGIARGWIWDSVHGTRFLQSLIDPGSPLLILDAWDINDRGQIIATGLDITDPLAPRRLMLLTPINSCPADIDGDGDADVADFFAFVVAFAAGDPAADINGDGSIDVGDFFAFVAAFAAGCP